MSHSRNASTSSVDPFLTPPLSSATRFASLSEFPFDSSPPRSAPGTPLPPYSRHRPSLSQASFSSVSDALDFVEKFAPAPPTRRSRSRYLLTGAVAALVVVGIIAAGHSSGVVGRMRDKTFGQVVAFGEGLEDMGQFGEWSEYKKVEVDVPDQFTGGEAAPVTEPEPVYGPEPVMEIPAEGPIKVSAFPRPRLPDLDDKEEKYLGFLPHSGFHNQRIALENAMLLGFLLNRTVLVPPVWIGWPTMAKPYARLQQGWNDAVGMNPTSFGLRDGPASWELGESISFTTSSDNSTLAAELKADDDFHVAAAVRSQARKEANWAKHGWKIRPDGFPITNLTAADCKSYSVECRHTYKDTFLSWDFLAGLDTAAAKVKLVDRWDIRERALLAWLGVEQEDVFVLEDVARAYDLHLSDRHSFGEASSPLITPGSDAHKWHRTVSIGALNALPHKVLLMGSLFSSTKIDTAHPEAGELRELFDQSLAFRNPWLIQPADEVAARLGNDFLGVHARVGDGAFQRNSQENMEEVWERLMHQMEVEPEVRKAVWEQVKPLAKDKVKRNAVELGGGEVEPRAEGSVWTELDGAFEESELYYFDETTGIKHTLHKRAPLDEDELGLPTLRNLTCRAPLHTAPELLPFNQPLYLATDSRNPAEDPALAIFFHTFPCTFVLNDFDRPSELNDGVVVESVQQMSRLENENDGMPLGRLFLPFLEAVIAAKAKVVSGTPGSTFSSFAVGGMHRAYQADTQRA